MGDKFDFMFKDSYASLFVLGFILFAVFPIIRGIQAIIQRESSYRWSPTGQIPIWSEIKELKGSGAVIYGIGLIIFGLILVGVGIFIYRWIKFS